MYAVEPTESPLFRARVEQAQPSPEELMFSQVMWAATQCHRAGLPLTPAGLVGINPDLNELEVAEVMSGSKFASACAGRGIPLTEKPGLSAEQLAALAIYTDMTKPLSHARKLRAAGVTSAMWQGWLNQRAFVDELRFLSAQNLKHAVQIGEQRLAEMADAGHLQAIQFLFEMEGRFTRGAPQVDVRRMLLDVFNVLDEEGVDGRILERVAGKIKAMLGEPVEMSAQPVLMLSEQGGEASGVHHDTGSGA